MVCAAEAFGSVANPVLEYRLSAGMSRSDLALRLGIEPQIIERAERGVTLSLSPTLCEALERAGVDAASMAERYVQWRAAQAGPIAI